jgi:hypothetical protein
MPRTNATPRRQNAPIRPRRPATTVPDFLLACAGATLAMAAALAAATVVPGDVIHGDTGRALARVFAGTLVVASVMFTLMALLLLRDERTNGAHYWTPLLIGAIAGVLEAWFFLAGWASVLWLPPLLLLFAFRPLRRAGSWILNRGGSR